MIFISLPPAQGDAWKAARQLGHHVAERQKRTGGNQSATDRRSSPRLAARSTCHCRSTRRSHVGFVGACVVHRLVGHAGTHRQVQPRSTSRTAPRQKGHAHFQHGACIPAGRYPGAVCACDHAARSGSCADRPDGRHPNPARSRCLCGSQPSVRLRSDAPRCPPVMDTESIVSARSSDLLQLFRRGCTNQTVVAYPLEERGPGLHRHGHSRVRDCQFKERYRSRKCATTCRHAVMIEGTNSLRIVAIESSNLVRLRRLAAKRTVADNRLRLQTFVLQRCLSAELV